MGKKRGGKKADSTDESQAGSSQQQQQQQAPRPQHQQQGGPRQQQQGGSQPQHQRGPQQQHQGGPQQQQQRGPQQQQGGPRQQQQGGRQQQQQRGPQQQQGGPRQQQGGPRQQQQAGPQQQQQRGPQQQQGGPRQQQQGGPQQQQQRGPQQQQRGPQQQQQGGPRQQQQGGPQQQQQRGPQQPQRWTQQQQQGGPHQQQRGGPQQQQRGPQQHQQRSPSEPKQWGPPTQQQQQPVEQQGPPPQQKQWGPPAQQPQQQQQAAQQQRGPRGPPQQQPQSAQPPQQAPVPSPQPPSQQQQPGPSKPHGGGGDTSDTSTDILQINRHHKPGTIGRKIKIETNHLQINLGKLREAIHYDVDIEPDTPKKILPKVMEIFRQAHYSNRYPAFDGRKNLYSSSPLPFGQVVEGEVQLMLDERMKTYKVKVQFANKVDLSPLQDMRDINRSPAEALQCLDIVLRSAPSVSSITVGRNFFTKPRGQIINLGEGMEMYHGFFQSAIRGWKPLLNVDVAHKAFPKNVPVIDALIDVCSSRDYPCKPERDLHPNDARKFEKFMRMLKVVYEIPKIPSSRRSYRVNGLGESADRKQFKPDNGPSITVANYYATAKNYRLRYPHLPTLWVGSKQREDKILIPMELCIIEEGQAVARKMTENQTSSMIRVAATNTVVRKEKIMRSIQEANYNAHPCVREFNFSVGNQFEKMEARVLPPPGIQYSDGKVRVSRGVWRGDSNKYLEGATIGRWTVASAVRNCRDMDNLARMIETQGNRAGMQIAPATKPFQFIGGRQMMNDVLQFMKANATFDVIFVVVPNSGPQYGFVKKAAELKVGCLTQCIKLRTIGRLNPQTVGNILLKVNSKMNGKNHKTVDRPMIMNRPCMIMGADVTHPGPDSLNIPSVAAVTASYDANAFCYNICYRLQSPKAEIIEDLEAIVKDQLLFFYQKCRCKPERIVFFRDGVSEGQFKIVRNSEIRAIRSACKKLGNGDYEPKLTFLVVQKRHHTRMFPLDSRDSEDKNMNVPAGTCVDQTITNPFMQDFYLVSHASIQGVAKPTKYCTIWDDNDLSNDEIQQLSYFLCHMFTRCNRSVSYPAPTYYAHLAAARGKVYIEDDNLNMNKLEEEQKKYNILDVIQKGKPMFFV